MIELSGSWTLTQMQELCARIRLACDALGVDPTDLNLNDLSDGEAARLRREAQADVWAIINQ